MTSVWPFKGGPSTVSREEHAKLWLRLQDAKDDHFREVAEWERRYNAQSAELLAERQRLDRWRQAWEDQGNWYFNLVEAASSFLTVWLAKGYVSSDEHVAEGVPAVTATIRPALHLSLRLPLDRQGRRPVPAVRARIASEARVTEHPDISEGKGPYLNEDYSELWLPADRYTLNEARSEASSWAGELLGEWGRSRYVGKESASCHDHEDWEACYPDHRCCERMAWHFELYEGTYRGWRR